MGGRVLLPGYAQVLQYIREGKRLHNRVCTGTNIFSDHKYYVCDPYLGKKGSESSKSMKTASYIPYS